MEKKRESNFELLRIISILLIISFHYVYKSGYQLEHLTFNSYIIKTIWFFGELGVNLFVLITGYFMVKGKISAKKIVKLILEVYFYNLINVLLYSYYTGFKLRSIVLLFPVIFSRYWFVSAYLIIYLLSPFFNKLIYNMSKSEFQKLLIITVFIWGIIQTIFGIFANSTETLLFYTRFLWLIIVYFIGAYIRLYDIKFLNTKTKAIKTALISFGAMVFSIGFIYLFRNSFAKIGLEEYAYLYKPNNVFMMLLSMSVFQYFKQIKIKEIKVINVLASTSLGIYMLHDGLFCTILWQNILDTKTRLEGPLPICYIIATTIIIYIIGVIVDLIRQLFEKLIVNKTIDLKIWNKIYVKIHAKAEILLEKYF